MINKWKYLLVTSIIACGANSALAQYTQTPPSSPPTMPSTMPTTPMPSAPAPSMPTTMPTTMPSITTPGNGSTMTVSDPSQPISVQSASPTFTITLESNKSTGYSWFLKNLDHGLVKVVDHKYIKPAAQMPGAGGYEVWTFMAKPAAFSAPKQTTIKLIYARPWEKKSAKETDFNVSTQP